jgi:hypothetical protein
MRTTYINVEPKHSNIKKCAIQKHTQYEKNKTIYVLFLFHTFSHSYRILTSPPTEEWYMCEEEEKHEEKKKKEQKYAMQSMMSWHVTMTKTN